MAEVCLGPLAHGVVQKGEDPISLRAFNTRQSCEWCLWNGEGQVMPYVSPSGSGAIGGARNPRALQLASQNFASYSA